MSGPYNRVSRLARAMCMVPLSIVDIVQYDGKWWLTGCVGGDQPLPQTGKCHTVEEALDAAEAWLAPELERLED